MKGLRYAAGCALLSLLFLYANPAQSDELDSILGFLADAGVVDQAIVDAKPLIECLVQSSDPSQCIDLQQVSDELQSDAVSEAEQQAAKFVPEDPAVQAVVDIIRAANNEDWLRVLELTGVGLLGQIACKAGLSWGGPLKAFICDEWAAKVLAKTEPVVHEILVIVKSFPNVNLWDLISLFGFELACDIAEGEGVPLSGEVCSVLAAAVEAIADLGAAAVNAIGQGLQAVHDLVVGSGPNLLTPDQYYALLVRPLMYERVVERLTAGRQDLGLDHSEFVQCLNYYLNGPQAGFCEPLGSKLREEADALYTFVQTLPNNYFDAHLKQEARHRALVQYRSDEAAKYRSYIQQVSIKQWSDLVRGFINIGTYLPPGDGEAYFQDRFRLCRAEVNQLIGMANNNSWAVSGMTPNSIEDWVCYQAVGMRFSAALLAEQKRIGSEVIPHVQTLGCGPSVGSTTAELMFSCDSYPALGACQIYSEQEYESNRFCTLDAAKANAKLGLELVGVLTGVRCKYQDKDKSGASKPRISCRRPWKTDTCNALLESYVSRWGLEQTSIRMQCEYVPDKKFVDQEQRAEQVLHAINFGPVEGPARAGGDEAIAAIANSNNCSQQWDPLAINCPGLTTIPEIPKNLATPPIEPCPEDPDKNGADRVCYQTIFTAQDSAEELASGTDLSETSAPTDTIPAAGPTETTGVAGSATELTGTETPTNTVTPASPVTGTALEQPATAQPIGEQPAPASPAAPANPRGSGPAAPPNPCSMEVSYYIPQAPVIEASVSAVEVSDQLRIRCDYELVTETIEWPVCNDAARRRMEVLAFSQSSTRRYSGKFIVDGINIGVSSSPVEPASFSGEALWSYQDAGNHEVTCEIDNGLSGAVEDAETWLRQVVSHKIGVLSDLERVRRFDSASVIRLATELLQEQIEPLPAGSLARLVPATHEGTLMPKQ